MFIFNLKMVESPRYHSVDAPAVTRPRCGRSCGRPALSPRAVALAVFAVYAAGWCEMRTRVGVYALKFVYIRAAAWWLGGVPCDPPADVERVSYNFPPVHWSGDQPFWDHMPCSPESYQVTMPAAMMRAAAAGGGAPDDGVGCDDATIVTAFFDVGRGKWGGVFARGVETYLAEAEKVTLTLRNRQVWFTQPQFVDTIVRVRASHGLANRTVVIATHHRCLPVASLYNRTSAAMCAPGFLDYGLSVANPELRYPWYTMLQWAKVRFVEAATHLSAVSAPYFIWLDAGCHYPQCQPAEHADRCLRPWSGTNTSKLRMASPEPLTPDLERMSDWEFLKLRRAIIAGTIWGGGVDAVRRGAAAFTARVDSLLQQGLPDQDQAVWGLLLREGRDRDLLEPYYTAYEWLPVVTHFYAPPPGDASPRREEAGRWKLPR